MLEKEVMKTPIADAITQFHAIPPVILLNTTGRVSFCQRDAIWLDLLVDALEASCLEDWEAMTALLLSEELKPEQHTVSAYLAEAVFLPPGGAW